MCRPTLDAAFAAPALPLCDSPPIDNSVHDPGHPFGGHPAPLLRRRLSLNLASRHITRPVTPPVRLLRPNLSRPFTLKEDCHEASHDAVCLRRAARLQRRLLLDPRTWCRLRRLWRWM